MKKTRILTMIFAMIMVISMISAMCMSVSADETAAPEELVAAVAEQAADSTGSKALAAAIVVGIAAAAGAIAMGMAISKSADGIARQPEASGKINSVMMLGLVFIETLIIYALIVAILIIFVL